MKEQVQNLMKACLPEYIVDTTLYNYFPKIDHQPDFMKDSILLRFGSKREEIERYCEEVRQQRKEIMPRLYKGEEVSLTTKLYRKTNLRIGKVSVTNIPDFKPDAQIYVSQDVLDKTQRTFFEGENYGKVKMVYIPPERKKSGYVCVTSYEPFDPFKNVDWDEFLSRRSNFTTEEWIDMLIMSISRRNPDTLSARQKNWLLSKYIPYVEPLTHMYELGPKGTGKSHEHINFSKYGALMAGFFSRAQLFYNVRENTPGVMLTHDVGIWDEVNTSICNDWNGDLQNCMKTFMENGTTMVGTRKIEGNGCLFLQGNIRLTEDLQPIDYNFASCLPNALNSSAILDRISGFIPGWEIPKISMDGIYEGPSMVKEFMSVFFHSCLREKNFNWLFDILVKYDSQGAYVRHVASVKKLMSGLAKIIFPHMTEEVFYGMSSDERGKFISEYAKYCLEPAVEMRNYIYESLVHNDSEYKANPMPDFHIEWEEGTSLV